MSSAQARRRHLTRSVDEVAPDLLGALVTHAGVTVRVTEVEAYAGTADPASHAWRGPTPRTAVMFGPAGHLYLYRSHGLHWCANVATGPDGEAAAVLLRAGRVVAGEAAASARRGERVGADRLARGPGCLCQALGLTGEVGGVDLLDPSSPVTLHDGTLTARERVESGPRVGVSRAADVSWRWWIAGEPSVSAYRRSPRAFSMSLHAGSGEEAAGEIGHE